MNQIESYYRILQVHYGADRSDITASYRRLCKQYHPDINPSPEAEERMKLINLAYTALCDDKPAPFGAQYASSSQETLRKAELQKAATCITEYFSALLRNDFTSAYRFLSDYDKRYVTFQSFCEWRESVQKIFQLKEFSARPTSSVFAHRLKDGAEIPAIRHMISITEKNAALHTIENYRISKLTVLETTGWHVFLGYRDLSEISKVFEDFSAEHEKGEMARYWQEYCSNTCRELNMLNRNGFLKRAGAEIYRYRRYRQQMVVALFRVRPVSSSTPDDLQSDMTESASRIINASLRETDISAYLGNGVFAVLFVEMRKKHAELITQRIANKLRGSIHKELKISIYADSKFSVYDGGSLEEYIDSQFNDN